MESIAMGKKPTPRMFPEFTAEEFRDKVLRSDEHGQCLAHIQRTKRSRSGKTSKWQHTLDRNDAEFGHSQDSSLAGKPNLKMLRFCESLTGNQSFDPQSYDEIPFAITQSEPLFARLSDLGSRDGTTPYKRKEFLDLLSEMIQDDPEEHE